MDPVDLAKEVLANSYTFQLKAQFFHWNVKGPNFSELHEFFGSLYTEVFEACDGIAEQIRACNSFAPGSYARFSELSKIKGEENILSAEEMIAALEADNKIVLTSLIDCYKSCDSDEYIGLQNFIQDRIEIHKKHGWMLSAYTK
jgi:starvation-inducible DNA-binding protein